VRDVRSESKSGSIRNLRTPRRSPSSKKLSTATPQIIVDLTEIVISINPLSINPINPINPAE
jgi:hypothetical protein